MEKKLTDDQMSKVAGGNGSNVVHHYKENDYVVFTYGNTMYCYHIISLYPKSSDTYRAYQATKNLTSDKVFYSSTGVNFNGGPAGVEKTVYNECPSWCHDIK